MSNMQIDQVLAQIRALSATAGGKAPSAAATPAQGASFGEVLKQGIDAVNSSQQSADGLASAWERGTPSVDLAQVMVASQKASVSFRALTEVRNRLVSVYQDIMNMSI
jgi:flagellar hook-basal body complex protein FliE